MSRYSMITLALAATLLAGCSMFGKDNSNGSNVKAHRAVPMRDVPAAVDDAFRRDHPAATVNNVQQRKFDNGATGYRIDYTTNEGKSGTVEYNAQGQRAQ